jgi:transposase
MKTLIKKRGGIGCLSARDVPVFVCPVCETAEDRDLHAAMNMIRLGKQYGGDRRNLKPMDGETAAKPVEGDVSITGGSRKIPPFMAG